MNEETDFEKCVYCGKITTVPKAMPIHKRSYYIDGTGQLCQNCFNKIYNCIEMTKSGSDMLNDKIWEK